MMRTFAKVLFVWMALGSVACGTPKDKVCSGCTGDYLTSCEQAYSACKTNPACKTKDMKTVYADGLCQ